MSLQRVEASSMRRRTTRGPLLALTLLVAALLVGALAVPAASVRAAPQMPEYWFHVNSPNVTAASNDLYGVAAVSASDVWAVGSYFVTSGTPDRTLTEHWNGATWSIMSSPNVGPDSNDLYGIAAVAANNVWAVGSSINPNGGKFQTLVEHWNGASWSVVSSPNVNSTTESNILASVAAVSASDVWAVGYAYNPNTGVRSTLIEHWNGSAWSIAASPNPGGYENSLYGVTAVSASVVWAVGDYFDTASGPGGSLVEQWNGTAWNVVSSPNVGPYVNFLTSVAAVSASDIWTVGNYFDINITADQTLIDQWNGTAWSVVPSPNVGTADDNGLYGVAAVSASDVWAVGNYSSTSGGAGGSLIEHWNGTNWSIVPSPAANALSGVAAVSTNDVWAVGDYYNTSANATVTFTERYGYLFAGAAPGATRGALRNGIR